MRNNKITYTIITAALIGLLFSCSTKKNTPIRRVYHNITAYYNALYNANDAMKSAMDKMIKNENPNYSKILNIFPYANPKMASKVSGEMQRVLVKSSKVIKKHSITVKPKKRKKNKPREFYELPEYCKYVDDAYMLLGKASFFKRDIYAGIETFQYIIKQYSMMPVKYQGELWMAKSYIELKKYKKAKEFLDLIEGDNTFPKEYNKELFLTIADYYLRQYKFPKTIEYLKKAILLTKKKTEKYRYTYILAQISQEQGDKNQAYKNYSIVMRKNPDYQMVFNAQINMAQLYNSSQGSSVELEKDLLNMLKDFKNKDYLDQIYYALASIQKSKQNIPKALEYYKKSAQLSTKNKYQKGISYLAIADIFFAKPKYEKAQLYYDSTIMSLPKDYRNYKKINNKSKNLNELVKYIKIITRQDSLQKVAAMSPNARIALIDNIIKQLIEKEKAQKQKEQMERMASLNQQETNVPFNQGGKWYFYNATTVSMGEATFKQKWGERKLEDHWRRSNKEIVSNEDDNKDTQVDSTRITDNKKREFYLQDVPLTDSAIKISDSIIIKAFFSLANIYQTKLDNLKKAAETIVRLNKKYPKHDKIVRAYYNLYKIYNTLNDEQQSSYYYNLIINKYPNSVFAKIMTNPEYVKQLLQKNRQSEFLYKTTYRLFINNKYKQVISNCEKAESEYPNSELTPKFNLIKTFAEGKLADSITYVKLLKKYIKNYPKADEINYAKDVLSYYLTGHEAPKGVVKKKEKTLKDSTITEIKANYTMNEKENHLYVTIVDTRRTSANKIKFNLSNFNIDYYSILSFKVSDYIYSANYQLISVEPFSAWFNAMNYFESINYVDEVFASIPKKNYIQFVISKSNLQKLLKTKALNQYLVFFNKNYIKKREEKQ